MSCIRRFCSTHDIFIFINIAFAMYSGALLATAARLAWDPSTYTWFRYLCEAQYRVSAAYVLAAGLWLAVLVYLAAAAARQPTPAVGCLHLYSGGVVCLALSEVGYGAWMVTSMLQWWRTSPRAELARHGLDLLHDIKPALLVIDRYRDVARPVYDMIEEVEREAPNNVYVIGVFAFAGAILQVAAFIVARRLARRGRSAAGIDVSEKAVPVCAAVPVSEEDSDCGEGPRDPPPGWRKKANLRMYTILDKMF